MASFISIETIFQLVQVVGIQERESLLRFNEYFSDSKPLPQYSREFATASKDGFLLNFVRFGFLGSLMATLSFIAVTILIGLDPYLSPGFLALDLIFWFRGETINAASFQFSLFLSLALLLLKYRPFSAASVN